MSSGRRTFALTLAAFLLLATACGNGDTTVGEGASEPTAETTPDATLGDGEQVRVRGTVGDVIADVAFTLSDATVEEGTVDTQGEVAVIVTEGDADISESEEVVVTGTLLSVDVADEVQELEDLLGVNVDDEMLEMLALLDAQQVVIASSVDEGV
jgi:hypothetical protein